MRISIRTTELNKALVGISKLKLEKDKKMFPVLKHVLINADYENKRVTITGTNLTEEATAIISGYNDVVVIGGGKCLFPLKDLKSIIKTKGKKDKFVTLHNENTMATPELLKEFSYYFEFGTVPNFIDFPISTHCSKGPFEKCPNCLEILRELEPFTNHKSTRYPQLTDVYFEEHAAYASNGVILFKRNTPVNKTPRRFTIQPTLFLLQTLKHHNDVSFCSRECESKHITIRAGNWVYTQKTDNAHFTKFDWEKFFPKTTDSDDYIVFNDPESVINMLKNYNDNFSELSFMISEKGTLSITLTNYHIHDKTVFFRDKLGVSVVKNTDKKIMRKFNLDYIFKIMKAGVTVMSFPRPTENQPVILKSPKGLYGTLMPKVN